FFFQAEDGIRDYKVTGVQTCALPISCGAGLICSATARFVCVRSQASRSSEMPMKRKVGAGLLLLASLHSAASVNLPFGSWSRASDGPILSPQGLGWESAGTFNPAVLFHDGKFIMLYRAQDTAGTSRLGYAESWDGIHF